MIIDSKVAIVTGASSGIGLATAKLLTKHGAKVVLVSRSKDKLEKISKKLPDSLVFVADMTKSVDIKSMVQVVKKRYGRVDILVNNAGQGYDAPIERINIDTFRKVFELDVVGPLFAMQQVIPIMRKQGEGVIVNISSGTALMNLPNMAGYSSLKRALSGISMTAREELKSDNISVSVVYPYITATDFEKNTIKDGIEQTEEDGGGPPFPPDSAQLVAQKILDAITTGEGEVFVHDWMKPRNV